MTHVLVHRVYRWLHRNDAPRWGLIVRGTCPLCRGVPEAWIAPFGRADR